MARSSFHVYLAAVITQWIRSWSWEFQPSCYNRRFGLISLQELLIIVVIYWTTPLRLTCFSFLSIWRERSKRTVRKWFRYHQEVRYSRTNFHNIDAFSVFIHHVTSVYLILLSAVFFNSSSFNSVTPLSTLLSTILAKSFGFFFG